jgi:two-component system chemotaxis response regulator CheB
MPAGSKIRVLIVDDSALVRRLLSDALAAEPDFEVVGTAPDPYVARDRILELAPDVLTLDIEMPRMDGLTFLRKLMRFHPLPAVVISSLAQSSCKAALDALEAGAVEVLAKPCGPYSVGDLQRTLAQTLRAAAAARIRTAAPPEAATAAPHSLAEKAVDTDGLIAIGASTGGTEAIAAILKRLPAASPPLVITQHIPPGFSRAFANRLNDNSQLNVKEAEDGDRITPGTALVAPGDFHMSVHRREDEMTVHIRPGPRVCYQRPSVDVLFASVAQAAGAKATGVLLTGMGSDGAQGLLRMRQSGARTIAQDESTCVVFGMPREAIALGAAEKVLPLYRIADHLIRPAPRSAV